jgi:FtsP/CotA-like multicopper oxidase with cupredoxin domain
MERRGFLKAGAAGITGAVLGSSGLLAWTPRAHATTVSKTFYITDGFITQPDGVNVYFRGFSAPNAALDVPGEALIVQEGDTVQITVHNTLASSHSFVIDGIADSQVNSGRISGGQTQTVTFTAKNPGSYLYYDDRSAPYNRLAGLHGAIAVMPAGHSNQLYAGSPTFVYQKFWLFNQIDPAWNNALSNGQTPSGAFRPRYFTINGLSGRPPGAPGAGSPTIDAMHNPDTALHGQIGDRTLVRMLNAGLAKHAVHTHGNHMEWLTRNGSVRSNVWLKDIIPLDGNMGKADMIYPFEAPPDAWPPATTGTYPMHLHDEMTQTAGGGLYMFGALTDIYFE